MEQGIVFDIKRYAIHDGPGIRVTVFLKGCPLDCWWCHNPEGQSLQPEIMLNELKTNVGPPICVKETIGRAMTVSEVMKEIEKERIFMEESGGGATFSGGEPLMQLPLLIALLKACKKRDIHTTVDTSGYARPEEFELIIDLTDLFLFDLKLMNPESHRKYTGVSNEHILHNLKTLAERGKPTILRFAAVPGITDTEVNLQELLDFAVSLKGINRMNLLPYHRIAEGKYHKLHKEYRMEGVQPLSEEALKAIKKRFEDRGLDVAIGG